MRSILFYSLVIFLSSKIIWGAEDDLLRNSPFLPPNWGKTSKKTTASRPTRANSALGRELEFRGFYEIDSEKYFSIYDKTKNRGQWYGLNEGSERFELVRFDPSKPSVTVRSGSNVEELPLKSADDRPIPVAGTPTTSTINRGKRVAPSTPAPAGMPPTPPPNFTPPPPPQDLVRKMNGFRGKNRTPSATSSPRGVGAPGSTRSPVAGNRGSSSNNVPGNGGSSSPSSAPSSSSPGSAPAPTPPPDFVPPVPPNYAPQ